jgi:hypothetical protein
MVMRGGNGRTDDEMRKAMMQWETQRTKDCAALADLLPVLRQLVDEHRKTPGQVSVVSLTQLELRMRVHQLLLHDANAEKLIELDARIRGQLDEVRRQNTHATEPAEQLVILDSQPACPADNEGWRV